MTASKRIDKQIADIGDWRGEVMAKLRKLIHEAGPKIQEDWKWDVGVYTHNGLACAVSAFKDHIKINFFNGAKLTKQTVFNSGLDSKSHRSINFAKNDTVDENVITELVKEAVKLNTK